MVKTITTKYSHFFILISMMPFYACSTDDIAYENIPSSEERMTESQNAENVGVKKPEINPTTATEPSVETVEEPMETASDIEPTPETTPEVIEDETPVAPIVESLQFTWTAGETAGLLNFRLYNKIDGAAEATLLQEVLPAALNLTAPTHSFAPSTEQLGAWKGKNVCFSIRAVNGEGESAPSMETCLDFL